MAGKLVVIGGAEDHEKHCTVLRSVLALSGETSPPVAVITAASAEPEQAGRDYGHTFKELGAGPVRVYKINSRHDARKPEAAAALQEAAVIFLTGGDQLRLTGLLGGTVLLEKVRERFGEGVILAGTSAGASAMSATMIVGGSSRQPPQRGLINMSPGLGFLPRVLVDQHFTQRGRFGRLVAAVALNPDLLGLGIDEDTAAVIDNEQRLEVVGSYGVTIIDGCSLRHGNVSETALRETFTLSAFRLHLLSHGSRFDLRRRRLMVAEK